MIAKQNLKRKLSHVFAAIVLLSMTVSLVEAEPWVDPSSKRTNDRWPIYSAVRPEARRVLEVERHGSEHIFLGYDIDSQKLVFKHSIGFNGIAFARATDAALASNNSLELIDIKDGKIIRSTKEVSGAYALACASNSPVCVGTTSDYNLFTWDTTSNKVQKWSVVSSADRLVESLTIRMHGSPRWLPRTPAISSDGTRVVIKRDDGQIQIWSAQGENLEVQKGEPYAEYIFSFDQDNKLHRGDSNALLGTLIQRAEAFGKTGVATIKEGGYCFKLPPDDLNRLDLCEGKDLRTPVNGSAPEAK